MEEISFHFNNFKLKNWKRKIFIYSYGNHEIIWPSKALICAIYFVMQFLQWSENYSGFKLDGSIYNWSNRFREKNKNIYKIFFEHVIEIINYLWVLKHTILFLLRILFLLNKKQMRKKKHFPRIWQIYKNIFSFDNKSFS